MVRHEACPRCGGQLIGWNDSDTSCLQCGHVVYSSNRLGSNLLQHDVDIDPDKLNRPTPRRLERQSDPPNLPQSGEA